MRNLLPILFIVLLIGTLGASVSRNNDAYIAGYAQGIADTTQAFERALK